MLSMVHSPRTRLHDPGSEIWVGVAIPGTEVAERVDVIADTLRSAGVGSVAPTDQPLDALFTVHDPEMVEFLRTVWDRWQLSIYPTEAGQDRVVPYAFPLRQMTSGRPPRKPASISAEVGMWAMDTMTLVGSGSWRAIEASTACALTAADMVSVGSIPTYALCRPPGHHAGRDFYGGSCYLNNAALAAQRLRDRGAGLVTIIDIDAHHGNGTQEIFYSRSDVRYASVHVDPGQGWFPHFAGYADELGAGAGVGANHNHPVNPGSDDAEWLEAVAGLTRFATGSDALVVSLGVDAAAGDDESPLEITLDGYRRAGALMADTGLPTVVVQEGGYDLETLGNLVLGFLEGLTGG